MEAAALVAGMVIGFPIFFAGLWIFVTFLIAHVSGWRQLADWYRGEIPPDAPKRRAARAAMGHGWFKASFRNVITLHVTPGGFGMKAFVLFALFSPQLVIPRGDVEVSAERIFFSDVYRIKFLKAPGLELLVRAPLGAWLESQGAIPKAVSAAK